MILLAKNIKYTQIRAGFHRGGASSRISANGFPAEHAHSRRGRLADKKSMVCAICVPVCHYHILRDACWSTWDIILYCNGLISNWMCTVSCFFSKRHGQLLSIDHLAYIKHIETPPSTVIKARLTKHHSKT